MKFYLVVSTQLKGISQFRSFPLFEVEHKTNFENKQLKEVSPKRGHFKIKVVFQTLFFRGPVSFLGCMNLYGPVCLKHGSEHRSFNGQNTS